MDTKRSLTLTDSPEQIVKKFSELQTRKDIAALLDIDVKTLIYHVYRVPEDQKYTTFSIPRKYGGTRTISAPITTLKIIQRKLNQVLQCMYEPNKAVHSYRNDKNIRTNAEQHIQRALILNVDLKDFFPSIHIGRVIGLFRHSPFNCEQVVAKTLAQICCYRGTLPQGAPTSPIISNMICEKMDKEIGRLTRKYGYTYTRYADDITLSTLDSDFSDGVAKFNPDGQLEVGTELLEIIHKNSFKINQEKIRIRNVNERQIVTGLVTNKFPNVRREYVRKIRAMLHAWRQFGLEAAEEHYHNLYFDHALRDPRRQLPSYASVVKGKIDYLGMIRGKDNPIYIRFLRVLKELDPEIVKKEETNLQSLILKIREAMPEFDFNPEEVGAHSSSKLPDLLNTIDPYFETKRTGAWLAFEGDTPDKITQATQSMREVLDQLLDKLAPDDEVTQTSWYPERLKDTKVPRKMKVRYILTGEESVASKPNVDFIETLLNTAENMHAQLKKKTDKQEGSKLSEAENYLNIYELIILIILQNRKIEVESATPKLKVFISYCDRDGINFAADTAVVLENHGKKAWYFDRDKSTGILRTVDITNHIRDWCDKLLYLCTNGSKSSTGQWKEIGQWDNTDKQILVFPIDGAEVPHDIDTYVHMTISGINFKPEFHEFVQNSWESAIKNWEEWFQKTKAT